MGNDGVRSSIIDMKDPGGDVIHFVSDKHVIGSTDVECITKAMDLATAGEFFEASMHLIVEKFKYRHLHLKSTKTIIYKFVVLKSHRSRLRITAAANDYLSAPGICCVK